ncbi:hypothetical protein CRI94_14940 [Longibacter salinarum]|uniref:HTTM domain-containing protein n=1 Tax=Longibacter salinarum TaxID=1850348 RepID=A0A2A8CV76_9BACT|nr:hypothetical protein CRI94_14940 [Longibacter salinarum]
MGYTLDFCWTWGTYIQNNITEVMLPLGIAEHIDISFLFDHNLAIWNAAIITALLFLGLFRLWRPAYGVAIVLFHLQYVARNCLGEISHGSNLVGMGILLLGLAHLFFTGASERRRFLMGSLYFFIGLGYTSAAVCKLVGTGIYWPDGHHLIMWITERRVDVISKFGAFQPNGLQNLVLGDYRWGTLILMFGLLAEASSFLMWFRKLRYVIVMLVFSMHIGIVVSMNIFFEASTYFLLLLGLPWHDLLNFGRDKLLGFPKREVSETAPPLMG